MTRTLVYCALCLVIGAEPAFACADLQVSDAWVRLPPPRASVAAAYMSLHNNSEQTLIVQPRAASCCDHVSLHETLFSEGRARMQHRHSLTLAPGVTTTLRPGGLHLMLMAVKKPLAVEASVTLDLSCNGETLTVEARVRDPQQ